MLFEKSLNSWDYQPPPPVPYKHAFDFSPDGSVLLIGDSTHLAAMSTSTMNVNNLTDPNHSAILGASFAPNGNEIAVIQGDFSIEVLTYPACTEVYRLQGHTELVAGAMFSQNGRYLITSSNDSTMRIWDMATGGLIYTYTYSSPLYTAGFSHDTKFVAASDGGTSVIVWDAPSSLKVPSQLSQITTTLLQNKPNSVTSETTIDYTVPFSEEVTVELFDIMGREVARIPQGRVSAGNNFVRLSKEVIHSLAPGVYYYRLESVSGIVTKRMVIE